MNNIKINKITCIGLLLLIPMSGFSQDATINKPEKNFYALWTELNDHYAFFEEKSVDWDMIYKKYSPKIKSNTTNDQLFSIFCDMLGELDDGHVSLSDKKTGKKFSSGKKAYFLQEFPTQDSLRLMLNTIDATLKTKGFNDLIYHKMKIPYLNNNIIAYTNNERYGYLRINLMIGISKKKLNNILDSVVESFRNLGGIIIDVRFNSGGYDKYSYQIANRFTDEKRVGHYKCTKKAEGFSELKTWYLEPTGANPIAKPIILLTSDLSRSATDVFALAMKELPYVTIVGDNTYGIFSDIKELKLPNKWHFTFSGQKYLSTEMKNYEGIGVSPDIKLLNTKNNIKDGFDPLLLEALKLLNQNAIDN